MRQPNHIILDFETNKALNSNFYWASTILKTEQKPLFLNYVNFSRKYDQSTISNPKHSFLGTSKSNTVRSNSMHKASFLKDWEKQGLKNIYKSSLAKNHKNHTENKSDMFNYLTLTSHEYTSSKLRRLLSSYSQRPNKTTNTHNLNTYMNLININFLRKERLYTKLKYSRSPAYDIVSGGAAALLAGFIGFLISEKFGYELVDSGDFYYAFMYGVFLTFSLKPLLTVSDSNKGFLACLSLRSALLFYVSLTKLLLKKFK